MFQKLVSHNEDIRRLVEKGYAIAFDSTYMIVRDIPYLDHEMKLCTGAFVTKLEFVDNSRVVQQDHQVFFAGSVPYNADGSQVQNLAGGPHPLALSDECKDILIQRTFSNKPKTLTGKFNDFFDKIESYVALISGPAINLHGATPYTFRTVEKNQSSSIFKFEDTLTSRAEITELSRKFENEIIAIIGLGGTGAYVLDFMVKTPVSEIRAFDLDSFHVHNAFRSPGKLDENELGKSKAAVYYSRYENFRHGLSITPKHIDETSNEELDGVTFAFVCVDKGSSRSNIFDLLIKKGIPFIDVGMGLSKAHDGTLKGMMRTTYFSALDAKKTCDEKLAEMSDSTEDLYRTNIQIGELNALNASIAVIRYKQLRGFYIQETPYYHMLFDLSDLKTVGKPIINANQT